MNRNKHIQVYIYIYVYVCINLCINICIYFPSKRSFRGLGGVGGAVDLAERAQISMQEHWPLVVSPVVCRLLESWVPNQQMCTGTFCGLPHRLLHGLPCGFPLGCTRSPPYRLPTWSLTWSPAWSLAWSPVWSPAYLLSAPLQIYCANTC